MSETEEMGIGKLLLLSTVLLVGVSCTNTIPEIAENFSFNGIVFDGKSSISYTVNSSPTCSSGLTVVGECDARISGLKFSVDDGSNWVEVASLSNGSDASCKDGKFSIVFADICQELGVADDEDVKKSILLKGSTLIGSSSQTSIDVVFDGTSGAPVVPVASIANAPTVVESSSAIFTVTLSQATTAAVHVDYATSLGSAGASDFTAVSGTLTFAAGETSKSVSVMTAADGLYEGADETFSLTLSNPVNATLGSASGTGTIADAQSPPVIQFASGAQNFNEAGGSATISVVPSVPSATPVSVTYTVSGTATGGGVDYTLASGTVVIPASASSVDILVPVVNDGVIEAVPETVIITLGTASLGTLGATAIHTLSIIDDDLPQISIADVTVTEGTTASFTISLSTSIASNVTVNWSTADVSAMAGTHYTVAAGTATILAGNTTTTVNVSTINNNDVCDPDRTFHVNLSTASANATIADAQAVGTIGGDTDRPTLSVADLTVPEGGIANVLVTLSQVCGTHNVGFVWNTNAVTASGSDFTPVSTSATIPAGQPSVILPVTTTGDSLDEVNETFMVVLSGPTEATILDGTADVTILDDDSPPVLSVAAVSGPEGSTLFFTFTLSASSEKTITVDRSTSNGTAIAPGDYLASSGTTTFLPGDVVKHVAVTTNTDALDESSETFSLNLVNPVNVTLAAGFAIGTITDMNPPTGTSISINGGAGSTTTAAVTLTLTAVGATEMYITNTSGCGGGGVYEAYSPSRVWNLGALNQNSFVYVKFRDAELNESSCISDSIVHDNLPPATPTSLVLISPPTSPGVDETPTLRADGLVVGDTLKIFDVPGCGSTPLVSVAVTGASQTATVPMLVADGVYNFYATSTDPVGNPSPCTNVALVYELLRDLVDDDASPTGFGGGDFGFNTMFNGFELKLNAAGMSASNGTFLSRVMDGTAPVTWQSIYFRQRFPSGRALPDFGMSESGYAIPAANASTAGSRLHYHLDATFYTGAASEVADMSASPQSGKGSPLTAYDPGGIFAGSALFNSGLSAIEVNPSSLLNFSDSFSMEAWIKPSATISNFLGRDSGIIDRGTYNFGFDPNGRLRFSVIQNAGGTFVSSRDSTSSSTTSVNALVPFRGAFYAAVSAANVSTEVDVQVCQDIAQDGCSGADWSTSLSNNLYDGAYAAIVFKDTLYVGFGDKGVGGKGEILRCSSTSSGVPGICDGPDWSLSHLGTDFEYVTSFAILGDRLYVGYHTWTGSVLAKVCDPAGGADPNVCEDGDWSVAITNSFSSFSSETYKGVYSMAILGERIYFGLGGTLGSHGDIYSCLPADATCDMDFEFSKDYNSSSGRAQVNSLLEFNNVLYAGFQATSSQLLFCDPKSSFPYDRCDQAKFVPTSIVVSGVDSVESLAAFGGKLYIGYGWSSGDGRLVTCNPAVSAPNHICTSTDSPSNSSVGPGYDIIPAMGTFNGAFYLGTGSSTNFGDIYRLDYATKEVASAPLSLPIGQWAHVAAVYNTADNAMRVYVNGMEAAFVNGGLLQHLPTTVPLFLGKYQGGRADSSAATHFAGSIDEVVIYNRALNAGEIYYRALRGGTRTEIQVRGCNSFDCSDGMFVGASGTPGTYFGDWMHSLGGPAPLPITGLFGFRYFQYRVQFYKLPTAAESPAIEYVEIDNSN